MKSLPTPLSVIAATPRKELDNKFIFNPYTNKVIALTLIGFYFIRYIFLLYFRSKGNMIPRETENRT